MSDNPLRLDFTKMCTYHKQGRCMRGLNCTFAHQKSQLQQCPYEEKFGVCDRNKSGNCQFQLHFVKPGHKATCQFGSNCWHIDNAKHCENFDHVLPERKHCPHGRKCYNSNRRHLEKHTHPPGWKPCEAQSAETCKDLSCEWCKLPDEVYVPSEKEEPNDEEEHEGKDDFPALPVKGDDAETKPRKEKPVKSETWAHVVQKKDGPTVSDGKKEQDFPALPVNGVVAEKKPTKNKKVSVLDVFEALIDENKDLIMEMIAKRIAKCASAKVVEDSNEANPANSWADLEE